MPWDDVETISKQNQPPTALIKYLRGKPRGKNVDQPRKGKPQLRITIPTTICGRANHKVFALKLGSGPEKGKARIVGTKDGTKGAVKPHEFKHAFTFNFGYVPVLGDDIFDERVEVRGISPEVFEFDLPACWK